MVYKSGQIFLPFCHNPRVWRTDRQTDRQTEFSSLDRVCIPCSVVKTKKQLESVKSVRWMRKVEELRRKEFVESMSFEPEVEERMSNGWWQLWWRKWRTDVCEIRWEAKVLGKLIPETGWCVTERAVVDLQRGRGRWAREGYDIWKNECYDGAEQR